MPEPSFLPESTLDESCVRMGLQAALGERRLLDHPFYRRWLAGGLEHGELAAYASQYRHFEAMLPGFLGDLAADLPPGDARDLVRANLADETANPVPHLELFEGFATAVGAGWSGMSPATARLVDCYRSCLDSGPARALGALAAYEVQSAEVADSKAQGLRSRYGIDREGTAFWEVHAEVDRRHADWVVAALAQVAAAGELECAMEGVAESAKAWWEFLDEREAARPAA
jgi:pyrroloquinoline quinone (PQQ) biosynthesis protein C